MKEHINRQTERVKRVLNKTEKKKNLKHRHIRETFKSIPERRLPQRTADYLQIRRITDNGMIIK